MKTLTAGLRVIFVVLGAVFTSADTHAASAGVFIQTRNFGEELEGTLFELDFTSRPAEVGDIGFHIVANTNFGRQRVALGGGPFIKLFESFSIVPLALFRLDLAHSEAYPGTGLGAKMYWNPRSDITGFVVAHYNLMTGDVENYLFANPRLVWWAYDFSEKVKFGLGTEAHGTILEGGDTSIGMGPVFILGFGKGPVNIRVAPLYDVGNMPRDRWSALLSLYADFGI